MSCSFMSQTNISSGCKKEEITLICDSFVGYLTSNTFVLPLGKQIYTNHVFNRECDFNFVKVL